MQRDPSWVALLFGALTSDAEVLNEIRPLIPLLPDQASPG